MNADLNRSLAEKAALCATLNPGDRNSEMRPTQIFVVGLFLLWAVNMVLPPYTVSALCKVDKTYRISEAIQVGNKVYSSSSVHQVVVSKKWIAEVNGAGCGQETGKSVLIRLDHKRALIADVGMCPEAREILDDKGEVDILSTCGQSLSNMGRIFTDTAWHTDDAQLIDNVERPRTHEPVWFGTPTTNGEIFKLLSAKAEVGPIYPGDGFSTLLHPISILKWSHFDEFTYYLPFPSIYINNVRRVGPPSGARGPFMRQYTHDGSGWTMVPAK